MADERLRIKIEADAKRAERDLENLAKLADDLTDDALTLFVDAKTEAAQAEIKNLTKLLQQAEDPIDIKAITDGIKAAQDQIEQLGKTAEKVDSQKVDIDTTGSVQNLDNLEQSAGSSKSVLANMVGNTAQDLGALGGVAGSAGVAIGQMAEYMADASASGEGMGSIVRNFSKIIGPMIALSAAVLAGTKAWEAYTSRSKETARLTKDASDALAEQSGVMDAIKADVEGGTDAWSQLNRAIAASEDEFKKAATAMGVLGIPVEDLSRTMAALEGDSRAAMTQMFEDVGIPHDMAAAFADATAEGESFKEIFNLLQGTGLQGAAENYRPVIEAVEELNDAQQKFDVEDMAKRQLEAAEASEEWGDAVKQARFELRDGATELQIFQRFSRIQADTIAEQTGETAKATAKQELWRAEMDKSNEAFAQGQAGLEAYNAAVASVDYGTVALEAATTAMGAFSAKRVESGNLLQDETDAWNALSESVKEHGFSLDTATEKGAEQQDALEDLAGVLDTQLATAYTDAAGDGDKFKASAQGIADTLRDRLINELGLSEEAADDVIYTLGLMPEDIETRYQLSGTEEAKLKLDLLSGSIDDLPKDVKAKVTQQIITGDYQGALATVQSYYDGNPAKLPVKPYLQFTAAQKAAMSRDLALGIGAGPNMMPLPPDETGGPVAMTTATTAATTGPVPAAWSSSPTVTVKFKADTQEVDRAFRNLGGRAVQSTAARYVWRNGRYLEAS